MTPDEIRKFIDRPPDEIQTLIVNMLGPAPWLKHEKCDTCDGLGLLFDPRDVGRRIGAWRVELGLTKESMAKALHVTRVYYFNLEIGERTWHASRILETIAILEAEAEAQKNGKAKPERKSRRIGGPRK